MTSWDAKKPHLTKIAIYSRSSTILTDLVYPSSHIQIAVIRDIIPELVDFGDEIFLASRIYLGGPMLRRNTVTFKKLSLANNSFGGNHAIVRGKF